MNVLKMMLPVLAIPLLFGCSHFRLSRSENPPPAINVAVGEVSVIALPMDWRGAGFCQSLQEYSKDCTFSIATLAKIPVTYAATIFDHGETPSGEALSPQKTIEIFKKLPLERVGRILNEMIGHYNKTSAILVTAAHQEPDYAVDLLMAIRDAELGQIPKGVAIKAVPNMAVITTREIPAGSVMDNLMKKLSERDATYAQELKKAIEVAKMHEQNSLR